MKKTEEWLKEEDHLEECKAKILVNKKSYEKQVNTLHKETQELYKAVQSGDSELYNQLMTNISLEEQVKNQLAKNIAAYSKPYFGRVDYDNLKEGCKEVIYIGKNGVTQNRTEVIIADWRAPISKAYYENEIGEGNYELPNGEKVDINLRLKRTFDIADGKMKGFYDSDVASNDELLVEYLSKNKDVVLGDIIATIQKEQNEIIRATPYRNTIVQGVAGSGKTTVAIHRISYILYNYKERFTSNEFCIIGSNDMLINYITSGLPELDVFDVKQKRMDTMFIHLLKKHWKKRYKMVSADKSASQRCSTEYAKRLEDYLYEKRREIIYSADIVDKRYGLLLSKSSIEEILDLYDDYSVYNIMKILDERIIKKLKSKVDEKDILKELRTEYRSYSKKRMIKDSVDSIYIDFLSRYSDDTHMAEHISQLKNGIFDVYDAASMVLIYYRIYQREKDQEFGQIFVDEAQDFGALVYYVLKKVLPECYFTIMGDVSQNINYDTGMNDWDEIMNDVFSDKIDSFKLLSKSYRNTIEISEFAGEILDKASAGKYKIDPVIRHGLAVDKIESLDDSDKKEKMIRLLEEIKDRGYDTTAIIVRDDEQVKKVYNLIGEDVSLTDGSESGFTKGIMVLPVTLTKGLEFDTIVLFEPDLNAYLTDKAEAKLLYVAATRALHELHIML